MNWNALSVKTKSLWSQKSNYLLVFVSAILSFSIQMIISKNILPSFEGSSSVWLTSLFFFQTALLISYLSAVFFERFIFLFKLLIFIALLTLTFNVQIFSFLGPRIDLLIYLSSSVFLPFLVLSSISPLVQKDSSDNPYVFYVVSNIGSFIGIFIFPLAEYLFSLNDIFYFWKIAFLLISGLFLIKKITPKNYTRFNFNVDKFSFFEWTLISLIGNGVFLGFTSLITQEISAFSLIWSLSLGIFILTYILAFNSKNNLSEESLFKSLPVISIFAFSSVGGITLPRYALLIAYFLFLFYILMKVHKYLASKKPENKDLLYPYYLAISLGGFLAGLLVNVIFPMFLNNLIEVVIFSFAFVIFTFLKNKKWSLLKVGSLVFSLISLILSGIFILQKERLVFHQERNFYGVIKVGEDSERRWLIHSGTLHGMQLKNSKEPTVYYAKGTGAENTFIETNQIEKRNILAIGAGIGTISYYKKEADSLTFIDIDESVFDVSSKYFSYYKEIPSRKIIGDGRIELNKMKESFDIILVDAFSGDAIPTHLLTEEAMDLYLSKITEDGVVSFHISNSFLDLEPVLYSYCKNKKVHCTTFDSIISFTTSSWVLIKKKPFNQETYSIPLRN